MLIADDKATDKTHYKDVFGKEFTDLRKETFDWLKGQELAVFLFWAGNYPVGAGGIAIAPANAGFFALGLAFLQKIMPIDELQEDFKLNSVIYVAPPFRHTHFDGKQRVVHNRLDDIHEIFSYNLYPRSEEHTSELQSRPHLVCRLLLEKKKKK